MRCRGKQRDCVSKKNPDIRIMIAPASGHLIGTWGESGFIVGSYYFQDTTRTEKPVIDTVAGHPSGRRPFIITGGMGASVPIIKKNNENLFLKEKMSGLFPPLIFYSRGTATTLPASGPCTSHRPCCSTGWLPARWCKRPAGQSASPHIPSPAGCSRCTSRA